MNPYVAISGNIGVGKTTITSAVAEKLGWSPYYEPVIDNPYLDDFYEDMNRWSFHLQVYFLSKRFEAQKKISSSTRPCIQDRTIYEDVEIFARTLHRQGFMNPRDYENYRDLFNEMVSYLRPPDLVVYLHADVNVLYERIMKRGRESEKTISLEYLGALNNAYEGWAERAKKISSVTIIDTNKSGVNGNGGVVDMVVEDIRKQFGLMSI